MTTDTGNRASRRAEILVIGPMPPPVHGYSVVTKFIAEKLAAVARIEVINIAPDGLIRNRRYHAQRMLRAARALWRVLVARRHSRSLYFAIAGGAGIAYDLPLALAARLLGYKIYVHHHSFSYINRRSPWTALLLAVFGRAATHICLSSGMARRLGALYPQAQRTVVLSNAALIAPRPPRTARSGPIRLGFLGNLIPEKGADTAIAVGRELRKQDRAIVLTIAGPALDSDTEALLAETQRSLGAAFTYHGAVYGAEKAAFLESLDLLLFPTRYANEAQPLVVLEALAAGIPVLATNRGAIAEDVGGHAAVFADQDYVDGAVRMIGAWCMDRRPLAALSAETTACADAAHRAALEGLAALLRAMTTA
jgi:glycosyltransferase involved in cell wall biosynthesis